MRNPYFMRLFCIILTTLVLEARAELVTFEMPILYKKKIYFQVDTTKATAATVGALLDALDDAEPDNQARLRLALENDDVMKYGSYARIFPPIIINDENHYQVPLYEVSTKWLTTIVDQLTARANPPQTAIEAIRSRLGNVPSDKDYKDGLTRRVVKAERITREKAEQLIQDGLAERHGEQELAGEPIEKRAKLDEQRVLEEQIPAPLDAQGEGEHAQWGLLTLPVVDGVDWRLGSWEPEINNDEAWWLGGAHFGSWNL